jgi:hypothetical protein
MLRIFGKTKSDHPMADPREARRLLNGLPAGDAIRCLDEINHWYESVRAERGIRAEHRAALALMLDEAAQASARKLGREYLSTPRMSKQQENRLWTAVHGFWRNATLAFVGCLESFVTGEKGAERLKNQLPLLTVRALRALATQMKWSYLRYAPIDPQLWRMAVGSYSLAERRRYARTSVVTYPGVPAETTPEREFLHVVMLSASSPDSLLPVEIEVCERLIGHLTSRFLLTSAPRGDTPYWIDLAASAPPLRHARPPLEVKSLRYFGAGDAVAEIDALASTIRATGEVPASVNLGGTYSPEQVLQVLEHVAAHWSPAPLERSHGRHRVKSRLTVAWGYEGVLDALSPDASLSFDGSRFESWIAENVSAGGMGAHVPRLKGDWLRVGVLVALQPEGGENWLLGIVRRIARAHAGDAQVGIQTISRQPSAVTLKVQAGDAVSLDTEAGILLAQSPGSNEADLMLRPRVHVAGHNLILERAGRNVVFIPIRVEERGGDYELVRCRQVVSESG